jgi:hypothetical protein
VDEANRDHRRIIEAATLAAHPASSFSLVINPNGPEASCVSTTDAVNGSHVNNGLQSATAPVDGNIQVAEVNNTLDASENIQDSIAKQPSKSVQLPCSVPVFKCVSGVEEADVGQNGNGKHHESHAAAANVMPVAQQEEHVSVDLFDGVCNEQYRIASNGLYKDQEIHQNSSVFTVKGNTNGVSGSQIDDRPVLVVDKDNIFNQPKTLEVYINNRKREADTDKNDMTFEDSRCKRIAVNFFDEQCDAL